VKNSVLFGWVKSGMKTGVQKAKQSIDKVVTTLDPQMAHLICEYDLETSISDSYLNLSQIPEVKQKS